MPDRPFTLEDYHQNDGGGPGVFGRAITEIPSATSELISEAWANPGATIGHAAKTVVEAGVMGTAIGYLVPARGPASILVGVALTAPAVYKAGSRLAAAEEASRDPLADQQAIAHMLARDTVSGTADLGLSLAGGYAGTELGYAMARSNGVFGRVGQTTQRGIMSVENRGLTWAKSISEGNIPGIKSGELPKVDMQGGLPKGPGSNSASLVNMRPTPEGLASSLVKPTGIAPERLPFGQRTLGILNRRAEQVMATPQTAIGGAKTNGAQGDYQMYMGSLHGHSRYSDGMGLPKDLYAKAKAEGYDFMAVTDHNHAAARGGVKPGDPRANDQAGTPTVAEDPIAYSQTFADAKAATKDGEFVGIVGVELGTIGKVAGGHHDDFLGPTFVAEAPKPPAPEVKLGGDPPAAGSGAPNGSRVGQIDISVKIPAKGGEAGPEGILPEVKEPIGTAPRLEPKPETPAGTDNAASTGEQSATRSLQELQAEAVSGKHLGGVNHIILLEMPQFVETIRETHSLLAPPEVVKVGDGNYKQLVEFLDGHKDTTGGTAVIELAHPRFRADENPNTPAADRGRDYGQKSFKSKQEWLDRFVDPYVRQIELIKGGALTPDPVDVVAPGHIDPTSYAGYLDKGVHASPTFGRDYHYGDPGGNPGSTGIMAKSLDKPSLMNALRERRTIATTNGEKLTGSMWGNDTHPMGSILDQAAVSDLALSAKIGGEVVPEAEYTVKLWGDTKLGDKKLAEVIDEKTVTGADLLQNGNSVSFDPITHKLGNKSAYYMEIQRKDPGTGHVDKMWTAPIWVEPLTGDKHSFYMRWLTGNSAQFLEGLARGK